MLLNFSGEKWRGDLGPRLVSTQVSSTGYGASIRSIIPRVGTQDNDVDFNPVDAIDGGGDYYDPPEISSRSTPAASSQRATVTLSANAKPPF